MKNNQSNEIDVRTLILIIITIMALINGLMSCTTSKAVYRIGNDWKPANAKSELTGWSRLTK